MTEFDWICPICGHDLRYKDGYVACDEVHGFTYPIRDKIQKAYRIDYKRFCIVDRQGYWEYAPHKHSRCSERKPKPGVVVAMVWMTAKDFSNGGYQMRSFRQCKPPRQKKSRPVT